VMVDLSTCRCQEDFFLGKFVRGFEICLLELLQENLKAGIGLIMASTILRTILEHLCMVRPKNSI